MRTVNLLDFLNKSEIIYTLDYVSCKHNLVDFIDLITQDIQFTQKIDLGVIYLRTNTTNNYLLIDGLSRFLSLSLLLHAVCECYKKTSEKNNNAINLIRYKYLFNKGHTKLRLPHESQLLYEKIINGDRLSGKEKNHPMFKYLHKFWTDIKNEELQANNILKMLSKIYVNIVEVDNVSYRDLYYNLNKNNRKLDQIALIDDYINHFGNQREWLDIKKLYENKSDFCLFFKDFFITKFNFKDYNNDKLYDLFVNYFETMLQYMSEDVLIRKLKHSAILYHNLLNVNIDNENIKQAFIKIKMHNGEDTYAYILNIYEDFVEGRLTEITLLEILATIDEYLLKRQKTPNNVNFNELIKYLNAFITCK